MKFQSWKKTLVAYILLFAMLVSAAPISPVFSALEEGITAAGEQLEELVTEEATTEPEEDDGDIVEYASGDVIPEVFVTLSGALADGATGALIGTTDEDFAAGETFENLTVDDDETLTDEAGELVGTLGGVTGEVSEKELASPRQKLRAPAIARRENASLAAANNDSDIQINNFSATVRAGATRNGAGDWVWQATNSYADHRFTYRVNYSISGTYDYEPGEIVMRFPKSILRDRDGALADYYDMSVPHESDANLTAANVFVYRVEGSDVVVYNRVSCPAAQSGFIEVSYLTNKTTFDYADYGAQGKVNAKGGSDPFYATLRLTQRGRNEQSTTDRIPVYIDTGAVVTRTDKQQPTAFDAWQTQWGTAVKPANHGDYYYLVWPVHTWTRATQPYRLRFDDQFNETDTFFVGYSSSGSNYSSYGGLSEVLYESYNNYYRKDYVLTAHKKSTYDAILEDVGRYMLTNNVTATVDPIDQVDPDTKANGKNIYIKEKPHLVHPTGHFYMYKWGYDHRDRYVSSSDDIRRFNLFEFADGRHESIDDLRYLTYVHGYPYPWTLSDWARTHFDAVEADPAAYYGAEPVTYRLRDNEFYLKTIEDEEYSERLTPADYQIDRITLYTVTQSASYDPEAMKFVPSGTFRDADYAAGDKIAIFAETGGSGEFVKIADWYYKTRRFVYTSAAERIVDKTKTRDRDIYFKDGVTGYQLETTNAYWYTALGAYPYARLKHSATVDAYASRATADEEKVPKISLKNVAHSVVYDGGSAAAEPIVGFTREGVDYIVGEPRHSRIQKRVILYRNDKTEQEYTVTWHVDANENYTDADGSTKYVPQESGRFYDLLPAGSVYKPGSLVAYADGKALSREQFSVTVTENYRGSGRTLLTLELYPGADRYGFDYSTVHSWEAIADFGADILNTAAYETGNADLGDGLAAGETPAGATGTALTESSLMTGLDPAAGDAPRFIYTEDSHICDIIVAASMGLKKQVRAAGDTSYSYETTTYNDSDYSYNIRFSTDEETEANALVVFDSLENYVVAAGEDQGAVSEWRGTFTGIDVSQPEALGIAPKVYYSVVGNLDIDAHHDLTDSSVWVPRERFTGSLDRVRAFAVDLREAAAGGAYTLPSSSAVNITVFMRSPRGVVSDSLEPLAYNNIYLNNNTINKTTGMESGEKLIRQDYTRLKYRVRGDLSLTKVSSKDPAQVVEGVKFRLNGISDYGTAVDETLVTNRYGALSYKGLERGVYTLREVETSRDFFLNETEFTVTVSANGEVLLNGAPAPHRVENEPRIHGDLEFRKMGKVDRSSSILPLPGVRFKLAGYSNYGNRILRYAESDENGYVRFEDIEFGTYEMTETVSVKGYILSNIRYSVRCDEYGVVSISYTDENGDTVRIGQDKNGDYPVLNEPLHGFRLVKYDPVNNSLLPGAEFTLTGVSAYGSQTALTAVTGADGTAAFLGLEPGRYVLRETRAPERYVLDETKRIVAVGADGSVTVEGASLMGESWHNGYYSDCFGVANERALEGVLTINKRWLDGNGDAIVDGGSLPIPVIHVDTEEPEIVLPKSDATVARYWGSRNRYWNASGGRAVLNNAVSFRKTTETLTKAQLPGNAVKVDDGATNASVYIWLDGDANAWWWSDAETVHFPENSDYLFYSFTKLKSLDLTGFDTGSVKNMQGMFRFCYGLTSLDVSGLDTGSVTDMSEMFQDCRGLTSLDVSGLDTGSVTNMKDMFRYCESLTSLDISGLDTRNVTDMTRMFDGCKSLTSLDFSGLDTGNVTNMVQMFNNCRGLTSLDLSGLDTGNVTNMSYMFYNCDKLTSLDVSGFDTRNVTDMGYMFYNCSSLSSLDLSSFDTRNVTNMRMMFNNCSSLTSLDVSSFDTRNITDMECMFEDCSSLTSLDVSSFDTGNVTKMRMMFDNCSSLTSLDLSNFDTRNVTNMNMMFNNCRSLTSLDLNGFDTGNVKDMGNMFNNCKSLTSLDLSGFNTRNVTTMHYMFRDCTGLTSLDLSSFDTSNVSSMLGMFNYCSQLITIYVSYQWSTSKISNPATATVFDNCSRLKGENGTTYSSANIYATYARIDRSGSPGYFTYKAYVAPASSPSGALTISPAGVKTARVALDRFLAAPAPALERATESAPERATEAPAPKNARKAPAARSGETGVVRFSAATESVKYTGGGSSSGVFDRWIDNGDGTWTYRMRVFDADAAYYVWEDPLPGFVSDLLEQGGYTVVEYPSQKTVTVTNTKDSRKTCSLTLKKELAGETTAEDLEKEFTFDVALTGSGITGRQVFGMTEFTGGKATVTLRGGEQIVFTGLPNYTRYNITEREANSGGFTTQYVRSYNGSTYYNNASRRNITFTAVNTRPPVTGGFTLKKTLTGDGLTQTDRERKFAFAIELSDLTLSGLYGDLIFENGKTTAFLSADETAEVSGLPAGTGYTVTEQPDPDFTPAEAEKTGAVAAGVIAEVEFENAKVPEEEKKTGGFTLAKTVDGVSTDREFTFYVSFASLTANAEYAMPGGGTFTADGEGKAEVTLALSHGGTAEFTGLPVGAAYTVSEAKSEYIASFEIVSPEGESDSLANESPDTPLVTPELTVEEGDPAAVTFTNTDRRFNVRFAKIDHENNYVAGAKLAIVEQGNEENVIAAWESDYEDAYISLPAGSFILRETEQPFGFTKAEDIAFTVDDMGRVTSGGDTVYLLSMTDIPIRLAVTGGRGLWIVAVSSAFALALLLGAYQINKRRSCVII